MRAFVRLFFAYVVAGVFAFSMVSVSAFGQTKKPLCSLHVEKMLEDAGGKKTTMRAKLKMLVSESDFARLVGVKEGERMTLLMFDPCSRERIAALAVETLKYLVSPNRLIAIYNKKRATPATATST